MSITSALLADRVASLLPKTTAGACVPASPWTSSRGSCGDNGCCNSYRDCHHSCHGGTVCGAWTLYWCVYKG